MNSLKELILYHSQRYQGTQPRDVYKLLFQGVFGPEHLLSNPDAAKENLIKEWNSVPAKADEELLEPVSMDGEMVRINLRSARAKIMDIENVWEVFLKSAQMPKPGAENFIKLWNDFIVMCRNGHFDFDLTDIEEFDADMKKSGYTAAHHSQLYRDKNWPAYRVVLKNEILKYI